MPDYAMYLIPGLGADERIFEHIRIHHPNTATITWIEPLENESLENYCRRLSRQIDTDDGREIILVGVSFGGIIAQEIARIIDAARIFIISSITSEQDLPSYLVFLGRSRIHRMLFPGALKRLGRILAPYFFSTETKEEKELLDDIIRGTDEGFMQWAIDRISDWTNPDIAGTIIHIHGVHDRVLPITTIRNAERIEGGHFMIVNRADEINAIIDRHLNQNTTTLPR